MKKEWDRNLLVLLTMVVLLVNVAHMSVLVCSMIFEMCKENSDSALLKSVRRRTSGMVPSSVQRYRERVADRKKKHRLSFDFANPTLNREDTLSTTIEMSSMREVSGSNNSVLEKDGFDRASTGGHNLHRHEQLPRCHQVTMNLRQTWMPLRCLRTP